jgi:calcineurin-like phosphoesterase
LKGFSLISKAKEDDKLKRDKLEDIYSKVNDCLKDMGRDVISTLNPYFNDRDVLEVLGKQRDRLRKRDYNLLVAGLCRYCVTKTQLHVYYTRLRWRSG